MSGISCLPAQNEQHSAEMVRLRRCTIQKKTKSTRISGVVSTQEFNKAHKVTETTGITEFEWIHGDLHDVKTKI